MSKNKKSDWRARDPHYEREKQRYEHPIPSREFILDQLADHGGPMRHSALAEKLGLEHPRDIEALKKRLESMTGDGQLVENRKGAYGPIERMNLVRGSVIGHRDGFGFLSPDDGGEDIFITPRTMKRLMHGDRIVVRVTGTDRRGRRQGALVDVLERANQTVVGRFMKESGVTFVIPDNSRINQDILIPEKNRGAAKSGQIVNVRILEQPSKRNQPIGEVIEVLGDHMAPGMEIDVAVRAHGIPFEWPQEVEKEAGEFTAEVPQEQKKGRKDLRDLPLVTIDGADARDFDDALCCEPDDKGWRLWVAIADVAAYVEKDSAIDAEATARGNSVYFPERVVPMLPEVLSNGLCSINPQVDRLCMVCEMRVDQNGRVTDSQFYEAVMRSHARLTYDLVAEMLENPAAAARMGHKTLLPHLQNLHQVYQALAKAREQRGAIDFETTELKMIFDAERKVQSIVPVPRTAAHRMIEECMIAANVQAAQFLTRQKLPLLYRVHTQPEQDRLADLQEFLQERGLTLGGGEDPQPEDFARLLEVASDRPDARLINTVALRTMPRAVYTPENKGHFGLGLKHYAHFTSPIRRYPDLLVHRAIKHALKKRKPADFAYTRTDMESLGAHCSATDRRADEATRDVIEWLKCEYMQDHVGDTFEGYISGVTAFGIFVELDDVYAEGLVHVSSLTNDYYQYDAKAHCLRGERSGKVHRLADRIKVKVVRVDLDERKIDFEPVDQPAARAKSGRRSKQNSKRRK